MESAIVVAIALIALVGGTVLLLSKQRMLPRTFPAFGTSSGATVEAPTVAIDEQPQPDEPVRLELVPAAGDVSAAPWQRIEDRLDALHQLIESQGESLAAESRQASSALLALAEADEARREIAHERLRADLLSAVSAVSERQRGARDRGMDVSAELYARLARLEAALCAVTNPILLPGEPYAPPTELLPETLVWENWNEVGERVFALADFFNAERLHLSPRAGADLAAFVTTLRSLLTRSVYPNLRPDLDATRQNVLGMAFAELAVELPKAREMLEREYRAG